MRPRLPTRPLAGALLAGLVALGACDTTYVTSDSTPETTGRAATTTVPSGGLGVLLPALQTELAELSTLIAEPGGGPERDRLATAQAVYDAARPQIEEQAPGLLAEFDRMMALAALAVERHRPADADKASTFIRPLIESALTSG